MATKKPKAVAGLEVGDQLEFHYQKSPHYRAIHVDGAHGGITPRGYIQFTLFNERAAIPRISTREVQSVSGPGQYELGPEEAKESLGGVMRHLEFTAYMNIQASREFLVWLNDKVRELEQGLNLPEAERVSFPSKQPETQND